MYIYTHICTHTHTIYIYIYVCMFIRIYVHTHTQTHTCVCVCVCLCVCAEGVNFVASLQPDILRMNQLRMATGAAHTRSDLTP